MTDPESIKNLLLQIIRDRTENTPRSQQKALGPSEIGHPCDRWIVFKLTDSPKAGGNRDRWRPTVGTAVHAYLAGLFEEFNETIGTTLFHVEERVNIGSVYGSDGYDIFGGCDLYVNGVVVDWKIVGKSTLASARRNGPGEQYRKQVHSYGRGWVRAGKPVEHVAVFFLPSSGSLDEAVWWSEPYDEQVCLDALTRVSRINLLVETYGRDAAGMVEMTDHYCATRCEWWRPRSTDPTKGCPGVIRPTGIDSILPPA